MTKDESKMTGFMAQRKDCIVKCIIHVWSVQFMLL